IAASISLALSLALSMLISFIHPLSCASSPQRPRFADKIDWLQARYRPSLFPVYQEPVAHRVRQA
ncbi:TPA: hypothetical protein ACGPDZ_004559, partial [Klebsiella variicola]